jgi:hypothetical protein
MTYQDRFRTNARKCLEKGATAFHTDLVTGILGRRRRGLQAGSHGDACAITRSHAWRVLASDRLATTLRARHVRQARDKHRENSKRDAFCYSDRRDAEWLKRCFDYPGTFNVLEFQMLAGILESVIL